MGIGHDVLRVLLFAGIAVLTFCLCVAPFYIGAWRRKRRHRPMRGYCDYCGMPIYEHEGNEPFHRNPCSRWVESWDNVRTTPL